MGDGVLPFRVSKHPADKQQNAVTVGRLEELG
jgi:hypothetical protein